MPRQPLNSLAEGQEGFVVALRGGRDFQQRIATQGLNVGSWVTVVQNGGEGAERGPVVVRSGETELTIGHGMAKKILVSDRVKIKDLQIGQSARVTGYATRDRDYRHKLLRMGMVRQADFTLLRVAPLGDPVVIELRGSNLTLRKAEADAVEIEVIAES
ncbi:MAG: ferrous iron transport protein A [Verrucomicrobia bacterium]|jgi:ferrous iron transport protein A|nr:ferrous iron transport protein A [Verrucomicrobiota bacterium]MBT7067772.1 ferrous iron transport protein A [Verrucomicrobiota bacterium]MBT7699193.1 ferrous iron transport protein A [Verrucomicrobiota bacterium]